MGLVYRAITRAVPCDTLAGYWRSPVVSFSREPQPENCDNLETPLQRDMLKTFAPGRVETLTGHGEQTCYRKVAFVNTNMYVEAFQHVLNIYLKGKVNKQVDRCIHVLLEFARDKAFERLVKLKKGKLVIYTSS